MELYTDNPITPDTVVIQVLVVVAAFILKDSWKATQAMRKWRCLSNTRWLNIIMVSMSLFTRDTNLQEQDIQHCKCSGLKSKTWFLYVFELTINTFWRTWTEMSQWLHYSQALCPSRMVKSFCRCASGWVRLTGIRWNSNIPIISLFWEYHFLLLRKSHGLELADIHIPNESNMSIQTGKGVNIFAGHCRNPAPDQPVVSCRSCLGCRIPGSQCNTFARLLDQAWCGAQVEP